MKKATLLLFLGGVFLAGCGTPQTLSVAIEGEGRVTSAPAGIDCGSDCEEVYEPGTAVTLFASSTREHIFQGWSGDSDCGRNPLCVVEMNQARSVRATFVRNPELCQGYSAPNITERPDNFSGLRELRWGIEEGCVQGRSWGSWNRFSLQDLPQREWYFVGSFCAIRGTGQELLRKTVISHPTFVGLPGSGQSYSPTAPRSCAFSPEDLEALASGSYTFQTGKNVYRATANGLGGFSVEAVDSSPLREEAWTLRRLLRVEISSSLGGRTTVDGRELECEDGTCFVLVSAGEEITLRANPEIGYIADGWEGSGTEDCQGETCTISPLQSLAVRALFSKERFQVTVENADGGTVSSRPNGILCGEECQMEFESGETIELFADPEENWIFEGWQGDCQGLEVCELVIDGPKVVRTAWQPFQAPEIRGPEVVRDPPGGEEPFWEVQTTGGGETECSIEEVEIYAGGSAEGDDPLDSTRRYKGPCAEDSNADNFLTPRIWPGRLGEDDEDVLEQTPGGSPIEQNGSTLDLPDGEYEVSVSQQLFYDSDPEDEREPTLIGSGRSAKIFYLDRKNPEPVTFRNPDQAGYEERDLQKIEGPDPARWYFSWGRDLTQRESLETGSKALWNEWRWNGQSWQQISDPEEAAIRCWIQPVEGREVQDVRLLSADWGECGLSQFNEEEESDRWAATPEQWPEGTFGDGQNNVGSLQEGRYRLFVEQRDRAGYTKTTVMPFQKIERFSLQSPNQDSVRFGARWQNIFVADTRQPTGSEGTIGEAWHPLRCRSGGVGFLDDCLDIDLDGSAIEKAEELSFLEGDEELWEKSFLIPDGEPGGSYRAQGYLRLATPGRFESNRGDRRSMHVRLLIDPVVKVEGEWEGGDNFCNYPLATTNSANIVAQAAATQYAQSDCQGTFPVQNVPRIYLRSQTEGIIADGDPIETREPIQISPRSDYRSQNAITGNSEIHICQPGVPRSLLGEIVDEDDYPDREEVLDVYDGQEGQLVTDQNRTSILGPVPDEDCQGHAMVWRWNNNVLQDIVVNTSQGYIYNGNPEICQALPREESFPAPPTLEEMADGGDPVARAVLGRVGSYRTGDDLPYQESSGRALWDSQGEGDPYVLSSAPWGASGRVRCSDGRYLGEPHGQWDLWLPTREKPNLISQSTGNDSAAVLPKGAVPPVTGPGFGSGLYSLPLASNLDGIPGTLDEGLLVDYQLAPATRSTADRSGYYWFMDARYYGYHLQRWAYSTDLDSKRQDIEVFAPRSSR